MPSKLNDFIRRAQEKAGSTRNVKSIVSQLLYGALWKEIQADEVVHRQFMRVGCDHYTAEYLKRIVAALEESGVLTDTADDQLDLWPETARQLVKSIARASVYVPSAEQYLKLQPGSITHEQVIEAGQHLITHGQDSMRRGERLIELGGLPWGPTH